MAPTGRSDRPGAAGTRGTLCCAGWGWPRGHRGAGRAVPRHRLSKGDATSSGPMSAWAVRQPWHHRGHRHRDRLRRPAAVAIFNYTTGQGCCPPRALPWPSHPTWGRFPLRGPVPAPRHHPRWHSSAAAPSRSAAAHRAGVSVRFIGGAPTAEGDMQGCARRQVWHTRRPATGRRHEHGTRYQEPAGGGQQPPALPAPPPHRGVPLPVRGVAGTALEAAPPALCHQLCGGSGRGVPAGGDWG